MDTETANANIEVVRRLFRAVEAESLRSYLEAVHDIYASDVIIREADSLPYGGEYRGHDGIVRHGTGYAETWAALQDGADRQLEPRFFAAGEDHVFVRWRQKARGRDGRRLNLPAVSIYRLAGGRIVEATMHHLDTTGLLEFLRSQDDAARQQ